MNQRNSGGNGGGDHVDDNGGDQCRNCKYEFPSVHGVLCIIDENNSEKRVHFSHNNS